MFVSFKGHGTRAVSGYIYVPPSTIGNIRKNFTDMRASFTQVFPVSIGIALQSVGTNY